VVRAVAVLEQTVAHQTVLLEQCILAVVRAEVLEMAFRALLVVQA
jgi:hypothetical protein